MKMIFLKLQALKKPDQKRFLVSSFVPQWYFAVDFFLFHSAVFSVTINHRSLGSLIYTMLSAKVKILDNSSVMMRMSPMVEGEVERAKRKRATVIVTRFILSLTKAVLQ